MRRTGSGRPSRLPWKPVDDTTWEFRLRDGVTFSDGEPFTADDVAFIIERVPNVPTTVTDMAEYVKPIARVEVVDRLTVRFHTRGPFPIGARISGGDANPFPSPCGRGQREGFPHRHLSVFIPSPYPLPQGEGEEFICVHHLS